MNISEHYTRNSRYMRYIAYVVLAVTASLFGYDYSVSSKRVWRPEHIEYIYGLVTGCLFLGISYSLANGRRTAVVQEKVPALLAETRLVLRMETAFLLKITYFSLNGQAVAQLREHYPSRLQRIGMGIASFTGAFFLPRQYTLYEGETPLVFIRKRGGLSSRYDLYTADGSRLSSFQFTGTMRRAEWKLLAGDGREEACFSSDLSAAWIQGTWANGGTLDMKEDGIPAEAVHTFSVSGGTLVTIYADHAAAYTVPALLLLMKQQGG